MFQLVAILPISKRASTLQNDFLIYEPPLCFLLSWVKSQSYLCNFIIFQATHLAAINRTLGKVKPTTGREIGLNIGL